ncbi:MAG: molybdenum cofactor guanylyltransferase [Marmoricola sp.]
MDEQPDVATNPLATNPRATNPQWAGVVLAGGGAVRMDGIDKSAVEIAGRTLLEHALAALGDLPEVVVVGPEVPTSRPVTFTREDPAGGGPGAGLLAGLRAFPRLPELVLVLAVDMPRVTTATVQRLRATATAHPDGAVLVDGRRQHLCAAYRTAALLAAAPAPEQQHGLPMHRLVGGLRLGEVPALGDEARDVDTWRDLRDLSDQDPSDRDPSDRDLSD